MREPEDIGAQMEYRLKIINSSAYVTRQGYIHAMLDFATPSVLLSTRETLVLASTLRELSSAVGRLPMCLEQLDHKIAQNMDADRRTIEFKSGKSEIITSTVTDDVAKFAARVPKLLHEIMHLLALGDAICRSPGHRLPITNVSVEFHTCAPRSAGETLETWVMAQKKRAIEFRYASSCQLGVTFVNKNDPYGLCPQQKEKNTQYLIRNPDNNVWIWFGELPRNTAGALRDFIQASEKKKKAVTIVPTSEVSLGLELLREQRGCNVIPFRR
jgi:hypothetical protein